MLQRIATLVAAAVFTVACAQTDAGITTNIKTKMAADDTVKAYQIDVDTRNGVVTLSGAVETAAAKEQAIRIARQSDGVRDVIDQLQVNEAAATGGTLERGYGELKQEGANAYSEAKQEGREAAETIREAGRDAADKTSDAANKAADAVADAAITTAVKTKFLADTTVKGLKIDVDTDGNIVTLNGTVSTKHEADRAEILARNTEGVERVINNLQIR